VESQAVVAVPLKIGEVARRSGLTVKTIRFYCDEGVIRPIGRSEGGYRLFADGVFAELALIRTLKAMDIPLQDVTRILESRRLGVCTCSALQATIRTKAGEIEQNITALRELQVELLGLLRDWEDCGGRKLSAA
jgi:DNA-binding transcriptional MerR regulator